MDIQKKKRADYINDKKTISHILDAASGGFADDEDCIANLIVTQGSENYVFSCAINELDDMCELVYDKVRNGELSPAILRSVLRLTQSIFGETK